MNRLFIGIAISCCLSFSVRAENPVLASGDNWIQNASARVEVTGQLAYSLWNREKNRWEGVFAGFPGGASMGAPEGTHVVEGKPTVSTRIDGQTACLDYTVVAELPSRGRTTVTIAVRLLPDSPLMQLSCLDLERKPVAVGYVLRLAHPGRYGVFDRPVDASQFSMGQSDASKTLRPFWLNWSGRRFLTVMDPFHPYVYGVFTPGGKPGPLACAAYSGGRRFTQFIAINEPFAVAGVMLAHDGQTDTVFHWATGCWQRLQNGGSTLGDKMIKGELTK
jgi:hypothetical protein